MAQEPISPRLKELLESSNQDAAVQQFWQNVAQSGPLIDPLDEQNVLITLLWREDGETTPVRLLWPAPRFNTHAFKRFANTDIYYLSVVVPKAAQVSYQLSRPQGITEHTSREALRLALRQSAFSDPLNPQRYALGGGAGSISLIDLSSTQPRVDPSVNRGTLVAHSLDSESLGNTRQLHVYSPAGFSASDELPLLVLFDGERFHQQLAFEHRLEQAIAAGLPALRVLFIENPSRESRQHELTCNAAFSSVLAKEWLPLIEQHYATSSTLVAGASFGGLASICAALDQPEAIDGVISLSGSFGWQERALLARVAQQPPQQPLYLTAGLMEEATPDGILGSNRDMQKILREQGAQVHYHEYAGGHDYWVWQSQLIRALGVLLSK